jgi:hypothetical protein
MTRVNLARRVAALPPDWREVWEERAAIREYSSGMLREDAELFALGDVELMRRREKEARR